MPQKPILHPLRTAGQSTDERMQAGFDDIWYSFGPTVIMVLLAAFEWKRYFFPHPAAPWVFTIFAILAVAVCAFHLQRVRSRTQKFRQGRDGERIVAEYLDRLRAEGFRVLHDVVGESFNIDHVLVGPPGVFVVETKTWSKRLGQDIHFDGKRLMIGGRENSAPLRQAKG